MAVTISAEVCPTAKSIMLKAFDGVTPAQLDWASGSPSLRWGEDETAADAMTPVTLTTSTYRALSSTSSFRKYAQLYLLPTANQAAIAAAAVVRFTWTTGVFTTADGANITGATVTATNHAFDETDIFDEWSDIPADAADDLRMWCNTGESKIYSGQFTTANVLEQTDMAWVRQSPAGSLDGIVYNSQDFPTNLPAGSVTLRRPIIHWVKGPVGVELWLTWNGGFTFQLGGQTTPGGGPVSQIGSQDTLGGLNRRRYLVNNSEQMFIHLTNASGSAPTEMHCFRSTMSDGAGRTLTRLDSLAIDRFAPYSGVRLMDWMSCNDSNACRADHITPEDYHAVRKTATESVSIADITIYANTEQFFYTQESGSLVKKSQALLVETTAAHPFVDGQQVTLSVDGGLSLGGFAQNNRKATVYRIDATHFVWAASTTESSGLLYPGGGTASVSISYLPKPSTVAAFVNETNANDLILAMPACLDANASETFIRAVWDALTASKKAAVTLWLEYSNEIWNPIFSVYFHMQWGFTARGYTSAAHYRGAVSKVMWDAAIAAITTDGRLGSATQIKRCIGCQSGADAFGTTSSITGLHNGFVAAGADYEAFLGAPYMGLTNMPRVNNAGGKGVNDVVSALGPDGFVTLLHAFEDYNRYITQWEPQADYVTNTLGKIYAGYEGGWHVTPGLWEPENKNIAARASRHPRAAKHLISVFNRLRDSGNWYSYNWFNLEYQPASNDGQAFFWGMFDAWNQVASRGDGVDGAADNEALIPLSTRKDFNGTDSVRAQVVLEWAGTVEPPPTPPIAFTTDAALGTYEVGDSPGITFTATGGVGAKMFEVTAGTFPAGLTLNANGTTSGTLTTAATYVFTLTADDGVTVPAATREFTMVVEAEVVPEPDPLVIATTTLAPFTEGVPGTQIITVTGGVPDYTYRDDATELPAGVTLTATNSTGLCVLTYDGEASAGETAWTFGVVDELTPTPNDETQALTLIIQAAPDVEPVNPPIIFDVDLTVVIKGVVRQRTLSAENITPEVKFYADQHIRCPVGTTAWSGAGSWGELTDGEMSITVGADTVNIRPGDGLNTTTLAAQADALGIERMWALALYLQATIRNILNSLEVEASRIWVTWDSDAEELVFSKDTRYSTQIVSIQAHGSPAGTDLSAAGYLNAAAGSTSAALPAGATVGEDDGLLTLDMDTADDYELAVIAIGDGVQAATKTFAFTVIEWWAAPETFVIHDLSRDAVEPAVKPDLTDYGFVTDEAAIMYMQDVYVSPGNTYRGDMPNEVLFKTWVTDNAPADGVLVLDFEAQDEPGDEIWSTWGNAETGSGLCNPDNVARFMMLLDWAREARDDIHVGFYGMAPYPSPGYWLYPQNNPATVATVEAIYETAAALFTAMDFASPSFYPGASTGSNGFDRRLASFPLAIADWRDRYPDKPLLPFVRFKYSDAGILNEYNHARYINSLASVDGLFFWETAATWEDDHTALLEQWASFLPTAPTVIGVPIPYSRSSVSYASGAGGRYAYELRR